MQQLATYALILFSSSLKFIFGPTIGLAANVHWVITSLLTASGMMLSVFTFTFFGEKIKAFYDSRFGKSKKQVFTKRNRQFVRIWNKYGIIGVSLLTPIIFTPIGGTLLVVALGGQKPEIFKYMTISAFFWAFVINAALKFAVVDMLQSLFGVVLVF